MDLLKAENLSATRGGKELFFDLDLRVGQGEFVTLNGRNGAGKTTLFSILAGVAEAQSGTVTFKGDDVTRLPLHRRASLGLGYLPQHSTLIARLSVEENLRVARENRGIVECDDLSALLGQFRLEPRREQRATTLSGGERRRLELARLMFLKPSLLLLDEPFAGLDQSSIESIIEILSELRGQVGLLVCDHQSEHLKRLADRQLLLEASGLSELGGGD